LDEVRQAVAFIFRLKGKKEMPRDDFKMASSMELHWFSPSDADKFLDIAIEKNYLEVKGEKIKPTFNISLIDIPIDFIPGKAVLTPPEKNKDDEVNLFMVIVEDICERTGLDKKDAISKINKVQADMNIEIEAASLIIAKASGIDVGKYTDEVERSIKSRY
jgi:hypothetical protein